LKLIELIKQNPAIFHEQSDDYKLAERKPIIWRDVAKKLQGSEPDASECYRYKII